MAHGARGKLDTQSRFTDDDDEDDEDDEEEEGEARGEAKDEAEAEAVGEGRGAGVATEVAAFFSVLGVAAVRAMKPSSASRDVWKLCVDLPGSVRCF